MLFGFVYPGQADTIPSWLMDDLLGRFRSEQPSVADRALCRGTLLSRAQYLVDVEKWGYLDARVPPFGRLTPDEMRQWTSEIDPAHRPAVAADQGPRRPNTALVQDGETSSATGSTPRAR